MTFKVSKDAYVRCTYAALQSAGLVHRASGLDEEWPRARSVDICSTEITGYTEWVDRIDGAVTIGWDWQMRAAAGVVTLRRTSDPRTNVMLVDVCGRDIGPAKTLDSLSALVDAFDWRSEVRRSLHGRYE
jgi:hypothetical protein